MFPYPQRRPFYERATNAGANKVLNTAEVKVGLEGVLLQVVVSTRAGLLLSLFRPQTSRVCFAFFFFPHTIFSTMTMMPALRDFVGQALCPSALMAICLWWTRAPGR